MITPQEAESRVFSKATFGGYNMAQVDDFLDTLIADYTAIYKENTALKSKLKILADKIEEYRTTEDAMRKALMTAQNMAESIIREAEAKRDAALHETRADTDKRITEIRRDLANEERRLTAARNSTATFISRLKELYAHELEFIGRLSNLTVPASSVQDTAQDIENTMTWMFGNSEPKKAPTEAAPPSEPVPYEPEELEPEEPKEPDLEMASAPAKQRKPADKQKKVTSETAPAQPEPENEASVGESEEEKPELSDAFAFSNLQFGKDYDFE